MIERREAEWAILGVAVAVFDAYAHGAKVPALAAATASTIDEALRISARTVRSSGIGMLLLHARRHLEALAEGNRSAIVRAAEVRDYFKPYIEGREPWN